MTHPQTAQVVLVGRPNSGKSSLYNRLTGGHATVANFPGITVDLLRTQVTLPQGQRVDVVDLPGFYSLHAVVDPRTDEGVASGYLREAQASKRPLVVVQVLDGNRLALGLRLTQDLLLESWPLVVAVTQRDVMERQGIALEETALSAALGVPVVFVSAHDPGAKATLLAAIEAALAARGSKPSPTPSPTPSPSRSPSPSPSPTPSPSPSPSPSPTPSRSPSRSPSPSPSPTPSPTPSRSPSRSPSPSPTPSPTPSPSPFDPDLLARRVLSDLSLLDAPMRARRMLTDRLDAWLLHPAIGPAIFLSLMTALFAAVFLLARPMSRLVEFLVGLGHAGLTRVFGDGLFSSFLSDGLLGGAGTVFAFLPQVVLLSVATEALQATGYLARGAFLVDRVLQLLGLSGRAFVPLLMGHACAVPAIAATRVIRDPLERLTCILVLPLMTCSARIPTYGLLIAAFFSARGAVFQALLFVGLYFTAIGFALIASLVLRRTATRGHGLPLVMELPDYRAPSPRLLLRKAFLSVRTFSGQVGKMIVLVSALLWVLLHVPAPGEPHPAGQPVPIGHSIAAKVGRTLSPVTQLAGFDWRINIGLLASFGARELMVGTLGVIYGIEDHGAPAEPLEVRLRETTHKDGTPAYGLPTGLSLLAFFLLACQCMSTVAAIRRETHGWKWPLFVLAYSYSAAFALSVAVYQGARALGL